MHPVDGLGKVLRIIMDHNGLRNALEVMAEKAHTPKTQIRSEQME